MKNRIRLVDGFKIRNTIDVDFSVIGDHRVYPYIEKGEVWFDRAFIKEKNFFIKLFKNRLLLMKKYGYERAKEILRTQTNSTAQKKIKRKIIKKEKNLTIYLVDGARVRKTLDPSFCFGGHWKVYKYIPKNEIWIDNATLPKERKYVIVHETYELKLMKKGMNYNNAHDFATAAEKSARRNDGVAHYLKD
ncbi:MAG: hypothetical protein AAB575_03515 [Patescibacteria group bacterium]